MFRHLSIYSRTLLSPKTVKPGLNPRNSSLISLSDSLPLKLRLFSSKTDSFTANSNSVPQTNSELEESSSEVEDVSNEELKRRIGKYFEGDEDALPSIFEAILRRKLAGKHDESDNELMEEFGHKPQEDVSDKEFCSDED